MPDNKVHYQKQGEKSVSAKLPKTQKIPNKIAAFKFPNRPDPALAAKYNRRKVTIIDKDKLLHPNRDANNDRIGTLRLF